MLTRACFQGVLVAGRGQRAQGGPLQRLEEEAAAPGQLLKRARVEQLALRREGVIQLGEADEDLVAQRGEHPALDELHPGFGLGLIAGRGGARGQDGRHIVRGQVLVRGIEHGLVETGVLDAALEVVGDRQGRHAPEVVVHPDVRRDPVGQALGPGGLDVEVVARAPRAHENLGLAHLARGGIDDGHRLAGVVDKDPLARPVLLAQDGIERGQPARVVGAELGVLVAGRVGGLVLQPPELAGDARALVFRVHRGPVGQRARRRGLAPRAEEPGLQRRLVHLGRQRPRKPGAAEASEVIGHGAARQAEARGDLPHAEVLFGVEPQQFEDRSHG
jgi:hypothetical protein